MSFAFEQACAEFALVSDQLSAVFKKHDSQESYLFAPECMNAALAFDWVKDRGEVIEKHHLHRDEGNLL